MTLIPRQPNNIRAVVKSGLCIGCGICAYSDDVNTTRYSDNDGQSVPTLTKSNRNDALAISLCPGKGYNIIKDSKNLYGSSQYDRELGYICSQYAAHSNDETILHNASSGGLMSQIAIFLLESRSVDRVLVTTFTYNSSPRAVGVLARSRSEVLSSQGSKYCPVDLSTVVREIKHNNYRVAVLGTPCQIAGIRNIQKQDEAFREKIVTTISTFCGGVKNYHNIDLLASRNNITPSKITFFRFRGKGQPGSMLIEDESGNQVEVPYPKYVGHTGVSKHLRCHLCVDATGELADIACGDAWLPRFQSSQNAWSIIITRNKKANDLVETMIKNRLITTAAVSVDEIKSSQRENLTSKKVRHKSRNYLYRLLGFSLPSFDGGYNDNALDISTELKVFCKHKIKTLLETMHLYYALHQFLK